VLNRTDAAHDQGAMKIDIEQEVPRFEPVSKERARALLTRYDYNKGALLDAHVKESVSTDEWRREKIAYSGADGEQALAYLYLPKNASPPYQVIHFFPAGDVAHRLRTVPQSIESDYKGLIHSGRAVFTVVLRGFPERDLPTELVNPDESSAEFVDATARNIIDLRRGLDYLLTRNDLDAARVVFLACSFGGPMMVQPAIESRYSAVVMSSAAISPKDSRYHPATNAVNFVPLIEAPKLFIHGRYDEASPLKTAAQPLFDLAPEPKEIILHDGAHRPNLEFLAATVSEWLDKKLGPVRRDGR
jgi:dienelactone hydrolase